MTSLVVALIAVAAIIWGLKGFTSGGSEGSFEWKNVSYDSNNFNLVFILLILGLVALLLARKR